MVLNFFRFWLEFILVVVWVFVVEDFIGESKSGEVVKLESDGNDLFTLWILRAFLNMFAIVGYRGSVTFSALDDTGVSRTFSLKGNYGDLIYHIFTTYNCPGGVRIRFGASSTAPSRTDNRLLQELYVDNSPRVDIREDVGYALIEGIAIFPSDTTICEVGLFLYATVSGDRTCGEFLIDRTVFNPCRSIPANTPYTVRYRVQL
jgi:hypothetical protein